MLPIEPKVGWLFRYSYLWHRHHLEGREEGDKDRPQTADKPLPEVFGGQLCRLKVNRHAGLRAGIQRDHVRDRKRLFSRRRRAVVGFRPSPE